MIAARIEGAGQAVGKEQGYLELFIRHEVCDGNECDCGPVMATAWEPTPDELLALVKGAKVEIRLRGEYHPPIIVGVGPVPDR